jgi:hypothetical protein
MACNDAPVAPSASWDEAPIPPSDLSAPARDAAMDLAMCTASCDAAPATMRFACGAEISISSLQDVLPLLGSAWAVDAPFISAVLPVTVDLQASGSLVLDASQIPIPSACQVDPECRPLVLFYIFPSYAPIPGVTLAGDADAGAPHGSGFVTDRPLLIASTGTRFRLRPVMYADHPYYSYVPMLEVLPPCSQPCDASSARCPVDDVCYGVGGAFCNRCLALGVDRCACIADNGPAPENSPCSYFVETDVMTGGACQCGRCVP